MSIAEDLAAIGLTSISELPDIGGSLSVPALEKITSKYRDSVENSLTIAGLLTDVDKPMLQLLVDTFRDMLACQDNLRAQGIMVVDRFGDSKPNPLMAELRGFRNQYQKWLSELGATPKSRFNMNINTNTKVPHGNAHSSNTLDIINGG